MGAYLLEKRNNSCFSLGMKVVKNIRVKNIQKETGHRELIIISTLDNIWDVTGDFRSKMYRCNNDR